MRGEGGPGDGLYALCLYVDCGTPRNNLLTKIGIFSYSSLPSIQYLLM